jgi:hypothetical protein
VRGTQVTGTSSIPLRLYKLDLDVTFFWVLERKGKKPALGKEVTAPLIRQSLRFLKCPEARSQVLGSPVLKTGALLFWFLFE